MDSEVDFSSSHLEWNVANCALLAWDMIQLELANGQISFTVNGAKPDERTELYRFSERPTMPNIRFYLKILTRGQY